MKKRAADFDAVVVGGGPAGASTAIRLARGGARVLLCEQERFPRQKLCGEFISPECLEHFARLGVLEGMKRAGGADVSATIFYSRGGRRLAVPSEWFGGARAALGLSRAEMDSRLLEGARAAGAEVLEGAPACGLLTEGGRVRGVRVCGEGGTREFTSLLTIDATGRRRALALRAERESQGRKAARGRAPLVAFKAHLEGARGADGVCEIYFYAGGYGGLSPVEGGTSNLCFIVRARDVRARGSDAGRVMREVLMQNERAARALAGARPVGPWLGVALEGFGRSRLTPAEGLLTVGDAASFIDPFTGSGMLMALESGELAAASVAAYLAGGRPDFGVLARDYGARYEARFGARLRLCGLLRRAAFAPPALAELAFVAFGASARLRRRLARATRPDARLAAAPGDRQ